MMNIKNELKNDLFEIKNTLIPFIKQPVLQIKKLPDWHWRTLIFAQILMTALSGILSGLFQRSATSILFGFFMMPILTLVTVSISSLFFFYTFQIFTEKHIEYRKIFTAVFFANIPFFIFQTISAIFPPISLVGLAFTSLLLVVAFVENYQVPRQFILRLIAAIYLLFAVITIFSYFQSRIQMSKYQTRDGFDKIPEIKLGQ